MSEPIYDHTCRCSDCGCRWMSEGEPTGCPNCEGSGTVSFTRNGAVAASKLPKQEPQGYTKSTVGDYGVIQSEVVQPLPTSESPTGKFFGTWPGEESDAELQASLAQIDRPASEGDGASKPKALTASDITEINKDKHTCGNSCNCTCGRTYLIADRSVLLFRKRDGHCNPKCTCEFGSKPTPPATSEAATLADRTIHHADEMVMDAVVGTDHLKQNLRQKLSTMPSGEKWSLYRAVVKLSDRVTRESKPGEPVGDVEFAFDRRQGAYMGSSNSFYLCSDADPVIERMRESIRAERALRIEAEKQKDHNGLLAYRRRLRAEAAEAKLADLVAENHSLKSALSAVGMENVVIAAEKEDANGK